MMLVGFRIFGGVVSFEGDGYGVGSGKSPPSINLMLILVEAVPYCNFIIYSPYDSQSTPPATKLVEKLPL